MAKVKDGRRKGKEEKRKGGGSSSIMKLAGCGNNIQRSLTYIILTVCIDRGALIRECV